MNIHPDIQAVLSGERRWCVVTGDCLDILPTLPDGCVDAVVTDPPYGLGLEYRSFIDTQENVRDLAAQWLPMARAVARSVAFTPGIGADRFYPNPDHVACWLMEAGGYMASWGFGMWQPILCYGKDRYLANGLGARPDVVKTNATDRVKPDHPCPKPTGVWVKVVERFSTDGDLVLDPFTGSGTTGIACSRLGRRFIGIELDPTYADIARRRIAAEEAQQPLFVPEAPKVKQQLLGIET